MAHSHPDNMRVITLEEHYQDDRLIAAQDQALDSAGPQFAKRAAKLLSLDAERLADMDAGGIEMQVLSHNVPAVENLDAPLAVSTGAEHQRSGGGSGRAASLPPGGFCHAAHA